MKIHGVCNFVCNLIMILSVQSNSCSIGCRTCTYDGEVQICTSCNDGYWLHGSSCPPCYNNCAICSNTSSCSTCQPGFYSPTSLCMSCPVNCFDGLCDENTGYCTECPSERYGYHCKFDCGHCRNETCDLKQCTGGCKSGYWQDQNEINTNCQPCVDNCLSCVNSSICNVCEDGTYLSKYSATQNYCVPCSPTCEQCSIINSCSACKPGYYGTACEFVCSAIITDCQLCDWDAVSTVTCSQCDNGWPLQDNTCVAVPHECPINCENCSGDHVCEICKTGWVGSLCDVPCHDIPQCVACHDAGVSIVCNECYEGYVVMNGECIATSTNTTAAQSTYTPATPSSTKTTTVLPTWTTSTIESTMASTNSGQRQDSDQGGNKSIMFGAIAGGAAVLLIAVVLLTVCVIKRRKSKHRNNQHEIAADGQRMEEDLTDYPVYAKPNKTKLTQRNEDYIYTQPNKVKKISIQPTDDKEESEPSSHNNVTISFDIETVIVETDVDELQLETLEGELTTEIEMSNKYKELINVGVLVKIYAL